MSLKWGVTPLIDNFVDDTYYYLITVHTGMRRGAGTKSRVGFIVAGEEGDTGVRELYDGVRLVSVPFVEKFKNVSRIYLSNEFLLFFKYILS
jgi:hypothetical protein